MRASMEEHLKRWAADPTVGKVALAIYSDGNRHVLAKYEP